MRAAGSLRRTALSRVTLVGERRRVDLVLPSDEPVGRLLPEVLRLLDDPVADRPMLRQLVTADGTVLAEDKSLEESGVADGAVLRLVREEDAPSAPVVHDVTDEAADDLDVRAWRWRPAARRVVSGIAAVGWALAAGALARQEFQLGAVGVALAVLAVVAALAGVLLGRAGHRGSATASLVTGGALGLLGVWTLADAHHWAGALRLGGMAGTAVVALLLLGWFSPLGRGGLAGGAAVAGCALAWEVAAGLQSGTGEVQLAHAGAVLAVLSLVVLGVLPRLALMASGLSGLDDRRSRGTSVSRYQVSTALSATHRGLALATAVVAASAAVAGVLALGAPTVWTVPLACVTALVLALRARAFPLTGEVVALFAAGAVVAGRLAWVWWEHSAPGGRLGAVGPLALLVVLALVPFAVLMVQPPEHVRVRLRRFGDLLESVGVIALFPLVLGVFGVYGRLLGTFA
ncbi:type VII secretion integral membrane protein EccD [Streptomyces gamaensis]|uniref:Type VII secretion integral membrane protein EccD n=1 Tax=Streptomyces gamaensis TaxID=1763542 RepID=A0ABW0YZH2_9ACTN